MESRPKSYSRIAADASVGFESHEAIEDASEEQTKSAKMRVVRVQNGP